VSDKVVSLRGEPIYQGSPQPDVITELEQLLEQARSGEVVGLAVALAYRDGTSSCGWGGIVSISVVGQCFSVAQRILRELNGWTNG